MSNPKVGTDEVFFEAAAAVSSKMAGGADNSPRNEVLLSPAQAKALQGDIAEINQLKLLFDTKMMAHNRHRDAIFEDGHINPQSVEECRLEERSGRTFLLVTKFKE